MSATLPAMSVNTWTLDGLSMNTGADPATGFAYLVKSSVGWMGSAPGRPDLQMRPSGDGAYRGPNYRGPRVVTLDGIAESAARADQDALADSLARILNDPNLIYPLTKVEYTRTLALYVELNTTVDVRPMPNGMVSFNVQLIATDPRKYAQGTGSRTASTVLFTPAVGGVLWLGSGGTTGTEWNGHTAGSTGLEWQQGSGTSGILGLANAGTDSAPVQFTINAPTTGTLIRPTITDSRGNTLTYSGTMVPGDVLTIDTATGLCLLNGGNVGGLFSRSDFFEIPARTTLTVQFSASGPAASALLTAAWSDVYA